MANSSQELDLSNPQQKCDLIEADTERWVAEGLVAEKYGYKSAAKNKIKQNLKKKK